MTVTINAGDTNEDIIEATATAINVALADVDDAVSATALSDTSTTMKLVLRSDSTGTTYKMDIEDVTGTLANMLDIDNEGKSATSTQGGYIYADSELVAEFDLDGVSITRDSNVLDDVINGITLTLHGHQESGDEPVDLTISPDVSSIRSTVENFITKYNETIAYLKEKTTTDTETGKRSALAGKYIYRSLLSQLRMTVAGAVTTTGSDEVQMLAQIGITAAVDGSLSISDSDDFEDAVESDPDAVAALFNSSTDGLANQLDDLLDPYAGTGGYIDTSRNNVDRRISSLDKSIERLEVRVARREQQLIRQYSSLQESLAMLSQQQNFLWSFLQSRSY